MEINKILHPEYITLGGEWEKWRYCWAGGRQFINKYLTRYSLRESDDDFNTRRNMTYAPSFAKSEITNVRNSIYERMVEVTRTSASQTYNLACEGKNGGVDRAGSTMTHFIGVNVLDELLVMGKVGIYVDMPSRTSTNLLSKTSPYIYFYRREQIKSWKYGDDGHFDILLLEDCIEDVDPDTGLPIGITERHRLYTRLPNKTVRMTVFHTNKEPEETILRIPYIPFVCMELSHSLMNDICDYQIALLNIESSDNSFIIKANFPVFAEQYDPQTHIEELFKRAVYVPETNNDTTSAAQGSVAEVKKSEDREKQVGVVKGKKYAKGLEYPQWIAPGTENIQASMMKQEAIKRDIKTLLNRSLASLKNNRSSAESKQADETEEEEGLSYIGLELQRGETLIAKYWCMYENKDLDSPEISYPPTYELKSEVDRIDESKKLLEVLYAVPSDTYRRSIFKKIATKLFNNRIRSSDLRKMIDEIDKSKWTFSPDPKTVNEAVLGGTLSAETGSLMQGLPEGEAEKAQVEHAERARRIAEAQADAANRGNPDMGDPLATKKEKQGTSDPTMSGDQGKGKAVRGTATK